MNQVTGHAPPAEDPDAVELLPLLKALWRGGWIILTAALLFGGAAYLFTRLWVTPTYRTGFTAYVYNRNQTETTTSLTSSDLSAAQSLVHTYAAILTSRSVLAGAAGRAALGSEYEYEELVDRVAVDVMDSTEILTVSVTMEDPRQALALAEALCRMAPDSVAQIVEGTSMQVVDAPVLPEEIYEPDYLRNTVLGVLGGALLAAGGIVLRKLMDDRVDGEEELERRFGIAVIGSIPDLTSAGRQDSHACRCGYGGKGGAAG